MAYEDQRVPRGTLRRWEVILADEERSRAAPRLRALDVRGQHTILRSMSEDDLARIPLAGAGEGLARYKEYLDLHDPGRADFLAEGSEVVKPGQRIVAKADVSRDIWDRLIESAHDVAGRGRHRTA